MKKISVFLCSLASVFGLLGTAKATLWDRENGLIYDDVLDITWLQDVNYGAGSIYDNGANTTDGGMSWQNAMDWADSLVYDGYDDWRLPDAYNQDGSRIQFGYSSDSEMAHMYYNNLGGTANNFPGADFVDGNGNSLSFLNLQDAPTCWTDDPTSTPSHAWLYYFELGELAYDWKTSSHSYYYAWAVRDGDVVPPVPIPASILLLGSGLFGLIGIRRKYQG